MANIVTKERKAYRIWDKANSVWNELKFLTTANSVDANDGDTMETKVGAIKGITTSTSVTEEGYAADAKTVSELSDSMGQVKTYVGSDGKLHFVDASGADTALNFSSGVDLKNAKFYGLGFYLINKGATATKTLSTTETSFDIILMTPIQRGANNVLGSIDITGGYTKKETIYISQPSVAAYEIMNVCLIYHIEKTTSSSLTITMTNKDTQAGFYPMAIILK